MISDQDRSIIRGLAAKWMETAAMPVMADRKRAWKAVHDLKADRPVILIETDWIAEYVSASEILCQDPFLRAVEKSMRLTLRHADELDDDLVVEPYYRMGWKMLFSDYGVPVETHYSVQQTDSMAYRFSFPIATPGDISKLKPRTLGVDRENTRVLKETLEDVMGDILPIRLANYDPFVYEFELGEFDDLGFCGSFFFGLTWQLYRFIGNDSLFRWVYDAPEAIHELMSYMLNDRIALFEFLENEGILAMNTDNQMAGPRSYGYTSDLPAPDSTDPVKLKNLWGWAESQETEGVSPEMYKEFALPYLAKVSEMFGLVYYGCCERVDNKLEMIMDAIPNLRSVSVSGWSDFAKCAEMMGKKYVYSRKPIPAHISGDKPHWDLLEKDMKDTFAVARDCNTEILYRDVYTTNGDRERLAKWVDMTKSIFQM